MVDLHHHLIFGVDDGSPDLATSVAMVEMAVADGVTHIVATPHANAEFSYDREGYTARLLQIRDALPAEVAANVTLGLGSDFHLNFENTTAIQTDKERFQINEGPYLLIELPDNSIPQRMDELLYELRVLGLIPILTHPERNTTLQRSRNRLREWIRTDLLVQVTAGSITGAFGKLAEKVAWELLEKQWVHFVSSDAHNLNRRTPRMSDAYKLVSKRLGEETAHRLFVSNPLAAFQGSAWPVQPEPKGVFAEESVSWWQRLTGRVS